MFSVGWFESFITKFSGNNASADHIATLSYPAEFTQIISEESYGTEQMFNAEITGLCWK